MHVLAQTLIITSTFPRLPNLLHQFHAKYLRRGLNEDLSEQFSSLDSSRAWIIYWATHGLHVLGKSEFVSALEVRIISTLKSFWDVETGGFGGGPNQIAHLAATYAAVNALVDLSSPQALSIIERKKLYSWLMSLKQDDGSFLMHIDGEFDVRGVYCALSVAFLCRIQTEELTKNCETWILSCQTYEGGFSGVPGGEAHGGYSFCAIAALSLLGSLHKCNLKSVRKWTANRQMNLEGGFSGRTNKLVDACYSFWQGAIFPLIHDPRKCVLIPSSISVLTSFLINPEAKSDSWLFNQEALQEYLLCCCQENIGGFIDKPGKKRDFYHSCYALSGLSVAQNGPQSRRVIGHDGNRVKPVHPIFNVTLSAFEFTRHYYEDD